MSSSSRTCGCTGVRSCLLCERTGGKKLTGRRKEEDVSSSCQLHQCHRCGRIAGGEEITEDASLPPLRACVTPCSPVPHLTGRCDETCYPDVKMVGVPFEGVMVVKEFMTEEEEESVMAAIEQQPWASSQSGRRKQDYGPKVNFKRQKVKLGSFSGLPAFSKQLIARMRREVEELVNFDPVELCNLDYTPERGSSIEPHLDDSWLWGERLVTLTLTSSIILTFSLTHNPPSTPSPPPSNCMTDSSLPHPSPSPHHPSHCHTTHIHIPLPRRSLVVVQGPARHTWFHSIQRRHVISRRVGITLRELANEFQAGGKEEVVGKVILDVANGYQGTPTNFSAVIL